MAWQPGDVVVLRELWRGRIWTARPLLVVQDTPDRAMFFGPAGTTYEAAAAPDGTWPRVRRDGWTLAERAWPDHHVLSFAWPGVAHAVLQLWSAADRAFEGWYVNLQEPLRRTAVGFDTADHVLDLEVAPDGSWAWKDEDELAEAVDLGLFTPAEAAGFRAEGERAIERLRRREEPFDGRWRDWRPDPSWPVPVLPSGWDVVESQPDAV